MATMLPRKGNLDIEAVQEKENKASSEELVEHSRRPSTWNALFARWHENKGVST